MIYLVALAAMLRFISIGGAIYEVVLVDRAWPGRPDIIRPADGGISRAHFWIPAHLAFELVLIAAIVSVWSSPTVRWPLVAALIVHGIMRAWSAARFIPEALRFERNDPALGQADAKRWVRESRLRLPLDLCAGIALLYGLIAAARI